MRYILLIVNHNILNVWEQYNQQGLKKNYT